MPIICMVIMLLLVLLPLIKCMDRMCRILGRRSGLGSIPWEPSKTWKTKKSSKDTSSRRRSLSRRHKKSLPCANSNTRETSKSLMLMRGCLGMKMIFKDREDSSIRWRRRLRIGSIRSMRRLIRSKHWRRNYNRNIELPKEFSKSYWNYNNLNYNSVLS